MEENIINHDLVINVNKRQVAKKSTLISAFVNVILATIQIFFGFVSHSSALIADGIHSLTDLVSDFVVLFANHHSSKSADEDHNYGHQRFENAASLFFNSKIHLLVPVKISRIRMHEAHFPSIAGKGPRVGTTAALSSSLISSTVIISVLASIVAFSSSLYSL